jgi:hypothetical protein
MALGCSLGGDRFYAGETSAQALSGCPELQILLHAQEQFRATADKLGKPQGHIGRYGTPPPQHRMQSLATDAHPARGVSYREIGMLFDDLTHKLARMRRRPHLIVNGQLSHVRLSSMVLLQVDPEGVSIDPFESDAPRSVHMDRVPLRSAAQSMKVEAGLFELVQRSGGVQGVQADKNTPLQGRRHFRRLASLEQFLQSPIPKSADHATRL